MPNLKYLAGVALLLVSSAYAQRAFPVPEGYRLESLDIVDGKVAVPADWTSRMGTLGRNSIVWTFAKDRRPDGSFDTGMSLQIFVGLSKSGVSSPMIAAIKAAEDIRKRGKLVRECDREEQEHFFKKCIELIETGSPANPAAEFHVLYSVMYGKVMDLLIISAFSAPEAEWNDLVPITQVMSNMRLFERRALK
jgi:hypothetical protein